MKRIIQRSVWLSAMAALLLGVPVQGEDLGIKNASTPEPGVMAAGLPTEAQIRALAQEGYKTVIDLMPPEENRGFDEPKVTREAGLRYINIPVTVPALDQAAIDQFLGAMRTAEKPVVVHCASSNRVGALYYSWLVLEKGMPKDQALEKAQAAGLRHPELTEKIQKLVAERGKG
jgi:uncharacterized protein (TIGR01244 family)